MTTTELIQALKDLEKNPDIKLFDEEFIPRNNPAVLEASYLAETVLITSEGYVDWDAIDVLKEAGYSVFPIEKDMFGWLIGGIQTGVGILTYG